MRCDAMRCDAMRCDAMRCDAMRCDAMRCDAMRCDAMRCDAMRCDAMRCDAMRCDAMRCDAMQRSLCVKSLWCTAQGDALQWLWSVGHDPVGLVSLFPSAEVYAQQLEMFMNKSIGWFLGNAIPNPYYWAGQWIQGLAAVNVSRHCGVCVCVCVCVLAAPVCVGLCCRRCCRKRARHHGPVAIRLCRASVCCTHPGDASRRCCTRCAAELCKCACAAQFWTRWCLQNEYTSGPEGGTMAGVPYCCCCVAAVASPAMCGGWSQCPAMTTTAP
jgi:pentapeptide MXKDX repeat protein